MSETETPEVWTSPAGRPCELHYVGMPAPIEDDEYGDGGWYPEGPGQLPPRCYELRTPVTGEVLEAHTVFPLEPWSPYDAIADRLLREGWTGPPPSAEELATCEHGLSAMLCNGPGHY